MRKSLIATIVAAVLVISIPGCKKEEVSPPRTLEQLKQDLKSPDQSVRMNAVEELGNRYGKKE